MTGAAWPRSSVATVNRGEIGVAIGDRPSPCSTAWLSSQLVDQLAGGRARLRADLGKDPVAALVGPEHAVVVATGAGKAHRQAPCGLVKRFGVKDGFGQPRSVVETAGGEGQLGGLVARVRRELPQALPALVDPVRLDPGKVGAPIDDLQGGKRGAQALGAATASGLGERALQLNRLRDRGELVAERDRGARGDQAAGRQHRTQPADGLPKVGAGGIVGAAVEQRVEQLVTLGSLLWA